MTGATKPYIRRFKFKTQYPMLLPARRWGFFFVSFSQVKTKTCMPTTRHEYLCDKLQGLKDALLASGRYDDAMTAMEATVALLRATP